MTKKQKEYARKFISKEIDKLFDMMEKYDLTFDDLKEYIETKK